MTVLPTYYKKKNPPPPETKSKKSKKIESSIPPSSPSLTSSILEGISFGAGSSIGHNIINKLSWYFTTEKNEKNEKINCEDFFKKFEDCKKNYGNFKKEWNTDACIDILTEYEDCKKVKK